MAIADDVAEEIEALEAIFEPECFERTSDTSIRLRVAPEPDSDGHVYGAATVDITFPPGYPADEPPGISVSGAGDVPEESRAEVQALAELTAAEGAGSVVVFAVAQAVREWLQDHTRRTPPPTPAAAAADAGAGGPGHGRGGAPSELDIDSEDLDEEMISALKDLLKSEPMKLQELKQIRKMSGKAQRDALRGVLRSLSPEQLEELVASSDDDSSEEESAGGPAAKRAAAKAVTPAVKLPPAQIECTAGHELTAFSAVPPDYRKFDGDEYTCDVCGRDGWYKAGVYHCTKCFAQGGKQFDACPACGSQARQGTGGKKAKGGNKKKR